MNSVIREKLVTVVIPTFNRAGVIAETLDSVLSQTHENLEIIVADDGSTDDTQTVVHSRFESALRGGKIQYFQQKNAGVGAARNLGLRKAHGEYIALLDSDDVWYPKKIELQLRALEQLPGAGLIWSDFAAINKKGERIHQRYLRPMYEGYRFFPELADIFNGSILIEEGVRAYWSDDFFSKISIGNLIHNSSVVLTRERQMEVGYFAEIRVGEDHDYFLRACKAGPVAFLDAETMDYRIGEDDAISASGKLYTVAEAFIGILEKTFRDHSSRIRLPRSVVRECFADAYAWAGRERLKRGDTRLARAHFIRSLRHRPLHAQTARYLAASHVPVTAREWAFEAWKNRKTAKVKT